MVEGRAELAMIAHELGGALAPSRNALQLLHGSGPGSLTPQQARLLAIATRGLERAGRVLENIAGIALPAAHEPRIESCVAREALQHWLDDVRPEAESRGIELQFEVADELEPFPVDLLSLEQVVGNLLSNALKFTPRGGTIRLSAQPTRAAVQTGRMPLLAGGFGFEPRFLQISVEDSGIGLTEETRRRLFQPFFRGAEAESTSGMGLGLAVARRLVRLLHGELQPLRRERGACFIVTLPGDASTHALVARIDAVREALRTDLAEGRSSVAILRGDALVGMHVEAVRDGLEAHLPDACCVRELSETTWVVWSKAPMRLFVGALDRVLLVGGDAVRESVHVRVIQASRGAAVDDFLLQTIVRCTQPLPAIRAEGRVFHGQNTRR